jgi:hypothetical protein
MSNAIKRLAKNFTSMKVYITENVNISGAMPAQIPLKASFQFSKEA